LSSLLTILEYSYSSCYHPHCLFFPTHVLSGVILTACSFQLLFCQLSYLLFSPTHVLSGVILTVLSYSCSVWCHPYCSLLPLFCLVLSGVILTACSFQLLFCLVSSLLFSPTPVLSGSVWCHPDCLFSPTPVLSGVILTACSLLLLPCPVSSSLPDLSYSCSVYSILYCSLHHLFCLLLSSVPIIPSTSFSAKCHPRCPHLRPLF
jgi:hypothetical protein